jgi:hypothetical protein
MPAKQSADAVKIVLLKIADQNIPGDICGIFRLKECHALTRKRALNLPAIGWYTVHTSLRVPNHNFSWKSVFKPNPPKTTPGQQP